MVERKDLLIWLLVMSAKQLQVTCIECGFVTVLLTVEMKY